MTIDQAIHRYLETVFLARSNHTHRAYSNALSAFVTCIQDYGLDSEQAPVKILPEDSIGWFAAFLKSFAPASESLYLTAAVGFFEFLAAENLAEPNLPRVRLLKRQRARRVGQRLPQFPRESIEKILKYVSKPATLTGQETNVLLREYRNRAFILTLADTGLRVHEACGLRRGDIDWNEGKAIVIGKGDRQAVIRFSSRCLAALKTYLSHRNQLDSVAGRPLASLPLFARHDRGAGKKIKPVTTATGRNIVRDIVTQALGDEAVGLITPHSFRHYFVTTVLQGSGGNLKLAQKLARHQNIQVTQRYAHLSEDELDRGYYDIFEAE